MKKLLICFVLVTLLTNFAQSKGIFTRPGAKASTMGRAFVAIADNASAIYWNPAGLVRLEGSGVELMGLYAAPTAKGDSLSNSPSPIPDMNDGDFPFPAIYVEPLAYTSKEFETGALLPGIAGYTKIKGITLGFGSYIVGGGGGKWEDSVKDVLTKTDIIDASLDASYGFLVSGLSVGKEVISNLSLALGLNYVYKFTKTEVEKTYTKGTGSALDLFGLNDYNLFFKKDAKGGGVEGVISLLYEPISLLRMGFVYRSGTTLKLSGTANYKQTGLLPLGRPDVDFETDYDEDHIYPQTIDFGLAYDPLEALTVSIGASWANYSKMKETVKYKTELPLIFVDGETDLNWKNTIEIRFGTEYRLEKLSLRGGLATDPNVLDSEKRTLLNTNQYDWTSLLLGVGYDFGIVKLDFNYGHTFSGKVKRNNREYEYPAASFQIGVNYEF